MQVSEHLILKYHQVRKLYMRNLPDQPVLSPLAHTTPFVPPVLSFFEESLGGCASSLKDNPSRLSSLDSPSHNPTTLIMNHDNSYLSLLPMHRWEIEANRSSCIRIRHDRIKTHCYSNLLHTDRSRIKKKPLSNSHLFSSDFFILLRYSMKTQE